MNGGDGVHDGQAEPVAAVVPGPLGGPLERLEQPVHFRGRDQAAGVADRQDRPPVSGPGADLGLAAGQVVLQRVVHQVRHQALGQARVTGRRGRGERGLDPDAAALCLGAAISEYLPGHVGQVEGVSPVEPALAARQREQGVDEPLLLRGLLRSLAAEGRAVLVSSHLMSELQDAAGHLVIVGRGRVIADTSTRDLLAAASDGRVTLRTAAVERAAEALTRAGGAVTAAAPGVLTVCGLSPERAVGLLTGYAIPFTEVSAHRATLEQAYLELTADAAEFRAETPGAAR